ncbi:uncharacterized protein LOC6569565 [Drosophila grimshawi]|uniref:GH14154 n=1 Tax=Drosophila grimshawi TaxID=7222 RepID=B4JXT7_DROGR|nr:uncharacterized protein LOC6569565 [Drosophila grimshawi]EDV90499.1 GH14154 [Drosophila grimshawi]
MDTLQRLLYVKDLSLEIGHHEIFEHFCIFGHLKRVTVRQRTEHYKYATILYTSDTSIELALSANPHNLRGKHYFCHKAGTSRKWPTNCCPNRLTNGISLHQYVYHSSVIAMPENFRVDQRNEPRAKRFSLLPEASMVLLHHLREEQKPPESAPASRLSPNINYKRLMSSMGESFNFVRHSYTNFVAHKRRPGLYDKLPIDAKISLTAIAYADVRDRRDLISFHYATD